MTAASAREVLLPPPQTPQTQELCWTFLSQGHLGLDTRLGVFRVGSLGVGLLWVTARCVCPLRMR